METGNLANNAANGRSPVVDLDGVVFGAEKCQIYRTIFGKIAMLKVGNGVKRKKMVRKIIHNIFFFREMKSNICFSSLSNFEI